MAAITLGSMTVLTVTYNGVQFGGSESDHTSTPPTYQMTGSFVYDDSGRAVKGTKYTLNVQCVFVESTEVLMHASMETLRIKLAAPGKQLDIEGLGTGFDIHVQEEDIDWGPKVVDLQMVPLGQSSWSLSWTVEFMIKECQSHTRHPLAFTAFNFNTSWQNDFEGLIQRTISGYVEIAISRASKNTAKIALHIVDEVRDNIRILIPKGWRRTTNTWRENDANNRLDFIVVDETLPGDYLPEGITAADGIVSFDSVGPGFAEANVSLAMDLRIAPDKPRSLAITTFLVAAIAKTNAMQAANTKGTVIPGSLHLSQGKFDRARDFSGSMTWYMTKCLNDMMKASGIWEPVVAGDYQKWRTSIENLWGNRGVAYQGVSARSLASGSFVIDLCDNITNVTIGETPSEHANFTNTFNQAFTCPTVPADGGWLGHELKLRVLRRDNQTWHRKGVSFLPSPGAIAGPGQPSTGRASIGGVPYTVGQGQEHDVEHHGLPEVYILLQFKGLRFMHHPPFPELVSVAGHPATLVENNVEPVRHAFDILVCPAWFIRGYRIYRVNGYVPDVKVMGSETSCSAPFKDPQTA